MNGSSKMCTSEIYTLFFQQFYDLKKGSAILDAFEIRPIFFFFLVSSKIHLFKSGRITLYTYVINKFFIPKYLKICNVLITFFAFTTQTCQNAEFVYFEHFKDKVNNNKKKNAGRNFVPLSAESAIALSHVSSGRPSFQ